eukprot:GFYU01001667.1.p1 GENE.GFYU01001667.1~~GFYU01001667.1.p1  ORF type:complete len:842 (+),score=94.39 GFYU01001667.1:131-2656(+)
MMKAYASPVVAPGSVCWPECHSELEAKCPGIERVLSRRFPNEKEMQKVLFEAIGQPCEVDWSDAFTEDPPAWTEKQFRFLSFVPLPGLVSHGITTIVMREFPLKGAYNGGKVRVVTPGSVSDIALIAVVTVKDPTPQAHIAHSKKDRRKGKKGKQRTDDARHTPMTTAGGKIEQDEERGNKDDDNKPRFRAVGRPSVLTVIETKLLTPSSSGPSERLWDQAFFQALGYMFSASSTHLMPDTSVDGELGTGYFFVQVYGRQDTTAKNDSTRSLSLGSISESTDADTVVEEIEPKGSTSAVQGASKKGESVDDPTAWTRRGVLFHPGNYTETWSYYLEKKTQTDARSCAEAILSTLQSAGGHVEQGKIYVDKGNDNPDTAKLRAVSNLRAVSRVPPGTSLWRSPLNSGDLHQGELLRVHDTKALMTYLQDCEDPKKGWEILFWNESFDHDTPTRLVVKVVARALRYGHQHEFNNDLGTVHGTWKEVQIIQKDHQQELKDRQQELKDRRQALTEFRATLASALKQCAWDDHYAVTRLWFWLVGRVPEQECEDSYQRLQQLALDVKYELSDPRNKETLQEAQQWTKLQLENNASLKDAPLLESYNRQTADSESPTLTTPGVDVVTKVFEKVLKAVYVCKEKPGVFFFVMRDMTDEYERATYEDVKENYLKFIQAVVVPLLELCGAGLVYTDMRCGLQNIWYSKKDKRFAVMDPDSITRNVTVHKTDGRYCTGERLTVNDSTTVVLQTLLVIYAASEDFTSVDLEDLLRKSLATHLFTDTEKDPRKPGLKMVLDKWKMELSEDVREKVVYTSLTNFVDAYCRVESLSIDDLKTAFERLTVTPEVGE